MDYSLLGSSVHGILQATILEWVAISFSRGSSWPGIEPRSLALWADALLAESPGSPCGLPIQRAGTLKLKLFLLMMFTCLKCWADLPNLEKVVPLETFGGGGAAVAGLQDPACAWQGGGRLSWKHPGHRPLSNTPPPTSDSCQASGDSRRVSLKLWVKRSNYWLTASFRNTEKR